MPGSCSGIHADKERHAGRDPHFAKDEFGLSSTMVPIG